jgi:hypothetical protein
VGWGGWVGGWVGGWGGGEREREKEKRALLGIFHNEGSRASPAHGLGVEAVGGKGEGVVGCVHLDASNHCPKCGRRKRVGGETKTSSGSQAWERAW